MVSLQSCIGFLSKISEASCLALAEKPKNVNAIASGNTLSDEGKGFVSDVDSYFKKYIEMVCVKQPSGQPSDLTGALLLLCSPAGNWITGQVLHVDGGWVLRP